MSFCTLANHKVNFKTADQLSFGEETLKCLPNFKGQFNQITNNNFQTDHRVFYHADKFCFAQVLRHPLSFLPPHQYNLGKLNLIWDAQCTENWTFEKLKQQHIFQEGLHITLGQQFLLETILYRRWKSSEHCPLLHILCVSFSLILPARYPMKAKFKKYVLCHLGELTFFLVR